MSEACGPDARPASFGASSKRATGAGSAAQSAIGIGVMGGMISATALGVFFVPLFFVSIARLTAKWSGQRQDQGRPHTTEA